MKTEKKIRFGAISVSPVFQKISDLQIILISCVLLILRVLFTPGQTDHTILLVLRISIPTLIALLTGLFVLDKRLHGKNTWIRVSSRNIFFAIFTILLTFFACILDILTGCSLILLLPGMMVIGFIYWNKPTVVFFSVIITCLSIAGFLYFKNQNIFFEELSFFFLSFFLTELSADTIRKNVVPNQERMQSLEEENKELWNMSYKDMLTGLYNRRFMAQKAEQLFTRAIRHREQLHVLMIDIDHFKKVNDTLGHSVGDEVLKAIATTIQTFVSSNDTVIRYGGEEFIVYIVNSTTETTQYVANRIRDGVASIHHSNVPWTVTISIGIASLKDDDTIENQIKRADQFLYASKRNGRNRVSGS